MFRVPVHPMLRSHCAFLAILALTLAAAPAAPIAATEAAPATAGGKAPAVTTAAAAGAPASSSASASTTSPAVAKSETPAKPLKKARFKGVVQDDRLQPLGGATVTVAVIPENDDDRRGGGGMGSGGGRMTMMRRGSNPPGRRGPRATFFSTKTDTAGAFTVDAEGAGTYNMRADAPGFAPTIVEKVQPGDSVSTLFLKKGVSVSGLVADLASGARVVDAEVLALQEDPKGFRDPEDPKRFGTAVKTGRDGTFTAANLAPGFYGFRVTATARARYETTAKPVGDAAPAAQPLIFYLEPGFDVSGRVLDPSGKPASSVEVYAEASRRNPAMFRLWSRGYAMTDTVTDKEGKFTLRGVPVEGKWTLQAAPKDYAPASMDIPTSRAGALVTGMELRLEKGITLRAKLVDADQKPVSTTVEATLTYRDPKTRKVLRTINRNTRETHVSSGGELTIEKLPSGLAAVSLQLEGFKDVDRKDVGIGKDNKPADLGTIVLDRGKRIAGRIVDTDGQPVAKASVSGSSFAPGNIQSVQTKTDKDGKFSLSGLEPEGNWTVEASAEGYSSARQEDVKPEGDPLELKLAKAGSVKGRVLFGDPPRPVPNFNLEADPRDEGGGAGGMMRALRFRGTGGRQSDPRGNFHLENLTPGSYTLTFKAEGLADLQRTSIDVRAGEETDLGDLTLEAGGTVRGRVQSQPEGLPVPGAAVRVKSSGLFDFRGMGANAEGAVLTDLAGRFEMKGLAAGTITLTIDPPNYARKEVANITVDPVSPGDDIVVNVGKGGRIEGTVIGDDGRPKANGIVTAMGGMADFSARMSAVTDEQGHYAIENVPSGTWNVSNLSIVTAEDDDEEQPQINQRRFGGLDTVPADVKDGQTSTVNFGEKKIKVSGFVKKKQGETSGLTVVWISVGSGGAPSSKIAITDANGHYEVTLPAPGEYTVVAADSGMRGGSTIKVTVPDTATFNYDVQVPDGAISGRITDAETGAPLTGVMVAAQAQLGKDEKPSLMGRQGSRTTSADDGTYRLSGLTPGTYDMTYTKEGYGAELRHGVEVKGTDEMSGTDLQLSKGISFKVHVTNPSGASVGGALIMVAQDGQVLSGIGGMTADDGTVSMKTLKPGMYSFIAMTRDFAPGVSRDVSVGGERDSDTTTVALTTGGTARIVVQDGGKQPISGAKVTLEWVGSPEMSSAMQLGAMMRGRNTTTGGDGVLPFERLPAGKYEFTVTKGDKTVTKTATVEEGAQADVVVKME